MKKPRKSRVRPQSQPRWVALLWGKADPGLSFLRSWGILALPALGLWAWRVPLVPFPGREWAAGCSALLAVAAWYAWVLPGPLIYGLLSTMGLAVYTLSVPAWQVSSSGWVAWCLFFGAAMIVPRVKDARLSLALSCVLWGAAASDLPSVGWVAAAFALVPPPSSRGRNQARWGALAVAALFFVLAAVRGRLSVSFLPILAGGHDWLWVKGLLVPMVLVWAAASFSNVKSALPWWAAQAAGWTLAWFMAGAVPLPWFSPEMMGLLWLAGVGTGVAAVRQVLLDKSGYADILSGALFLAFWAAY